MPVYSLTSSKPIKDTHKEKLTNLVTDVHCGLTGATEQFVHVLFAENIPLINGNELYIQANVRSGRTKATVADIRKQLVEKSAAILDIPISKVSINLLEIQPKWCMEGGYIMPEPGKEAEWFEKVNAALAEREQEQELA